MLPFLEHAVNNCGRTVSLCSAAAIAKGVLSIAKPAVVVENARKSLL
jgi:hypothetical protein